MNNPGHIKCLLCLHFCFQELILADKKEYYRKKVPIPTKQKKVYLILPVNHLGESLTLYLIRSMQLNTHQEFSYKGYVLCRSHRGIKLGMWKAMLIHLMDFPTTHISTRVTELDGFFILSPKCNNRNN